MDENLLAQLEAVKVQNYKLKMDIQVLWRQLSSNPYIEVTGCLSVCVCLSVFLWCAYLQRRFYFAM